MAIGHGALMRYAFAVAAAIVNLVAMSLAPTQAQAQAKAPPTYQIIREITVVVPEKKPNGQYWDTVIGGLIGLRLKGILPDVRICLRSTSIPRTCSAVCNDSNTCSWTPLVLLQPDTFIEIYDVDVGSEEVIAEMLLSEMSGCPNCVKDMPGGRLSVAYTAMASNNYTGAYAGTVGTQPWTPPPPASLPPAAPTRKPSRAELEAALSDVRVQGRCFGPDHIFPSGTVGQTANPHLQGGKVPQYRQLAMYIGAITDKLTQDAMLLRAQTALGSDYAFFYDIIYMDVQQGRRLDQLMRQALEEFADKLITRGLEKFVPAAPGNLGAALRDWMIARSSEDIAGQLVEDILSDNTLSAECATNEWAKEVFINRAIR